MRSFCFRFLTLSALGCASLGYSAPAHADELELISDVTGMYQTESRRRFGAELEYAIIDSPMLNASAGYRDGAPNMEFFTALLHRLSDDQILAVVCHELGHFFGNRFSFGEDAAVEGEADYFSGSCMTRYLREKRGMTASQAEDAAAHIADLEMSNLYEMHVTAECAYGHTPPPGSAWGIQVTYPEPDCRLLSVVHGIRGWARPACWYLPEAPAR